MQVGMIMFFQHGVPGVDDRQFIREELELGVQAEQLGFDFVGMPEHHFEDYSMCVDNIQALSYLAARTTRIGLLTAVVVLPWHDPIRVAERMILLDHLADGRAMFGIGRGLAPKEYAAFGIDQNEARARFDEMGPLVVNALETGVIQGDGPFYSYEPTELRPRPFKSFKDRLFGVATSPSSAIAAAKVGGRLTMVVTTAIEQMETVVEVYRETWRETHGTEPPAPLLTDHTFCTRDPELMKKAESTWYPKSWKMAVDHYQLDQVDFTSIKGYESHARRAQGPAFAKTQIWGTPERIVDQWRERLEILGEAMCGFIFRVGGMPFEIALDSVRLFAAEALPELKKLGVAVAAPADAVPAAR
jgi:alkanesulfonate monooxygenase SsuD/methylene tetrahydromethanopterin reductase-like flavin-dependent oxidoreductase (luciferase family)